MLRIQVLFACYEMVRPFEEPDIECYVLIDCVVIVIILSRYEVIIRWKIRIELHRFVKPLWVVTRQAERLLEEVERVAEHLTSAIFF